MNTPSLLDTLRVQFLLHFKVDRRQHAVSNMFALRVVEHLDVVEDILTRIDSGFVCYAPDTLAPQEVEEAFRNSIVMTVSAAAHAVFEIVLLQE